MIESSIYFLENVSLECLQVIFTDIVGIAIACQGGFGEYIFEIGQLLFQECILCTESSIVLTQFLLESLHLSDFVLELFLVALLSQTASYSTFSVLKSPIRID